MIPFVGNRRRAWLLAAGVAVLALGQCGGAFAMFTDSTTAGPGSFQTGTLPIPAGLAVSNGGCSGSPTQTNVASSWTGSSALDASGNYLVAGYSVLRSPSSSGPYSSAGTVTGSPPSTTYTDTSPSGAAAPLAFVASGSGSNALSIDTSTYATATVNLGGAVGKEPNALQVTPDGTKLIAAEGAAHQVQIISTTTGAVESTVAIPTVNGTASTPVAVAVSPDGSTAWIVDAANDLVYPLRLATATLGGAITVGAQGDPSAAVVTPNGVQVFVADYGSHQVSAIDTSTDAVTTIAVGGTTGIPIALAVTPNSAHVYVADEGNSQIDDITTSSDTVSATIKVPSLTDSDGYVPNGGDPNILAVTPNGAKVYVASFGDGLGGSVEDITTSNDAVATTFALPPGGVLGPAAPNALALTPNGCQLYVNDYDNNKVDLIDVSTDTLAASTTAVGQTGDPTGMAVTPNGAAVYVANFYDPSVSVIATSSYTVTRTVGMAGGSAPYAIAVAPSTYYYEVAGTHGGWTSGPSSPAVYTLGWNVGGWQ
jgi:YVTN family beta-propeller protein